MLKTNKWGACKKNLGSWLHNQLFLFTMISPKVFTIGTAIMVCACALVHACDCTCVCFCMFLFLNCSLKIQSKFWRNSRVTIMMPAQEEKLVITPTYLPDIFNIAATV